MKARRNESGKKVVSGGAAALWLLLPLFFLVVLKTDFLPQIARFRETGFTSVADEMVHKVKALGLDGERWRQQQPIDVAGSQSADDSPTSSDEMPSGDLHANRDSNLQKQILAMNGKADGSLLNSDVAAAAASKLTCNFSSYRMSTCVMEGDVRIHGKSATVYVVVSDHRPENNATIMIRPYPRKWEAPTMERVRDVTVRSSAAPGATDGAVVPPRCTVAHDVPAVIFSTGGYSANYFHAMTDIVVPLYITAREYGGRVQLLATDYDRKWIAKYGAVLAGLSVYPVIDFDEDAAVRCFPSAHVGIESHKELGIIPALSRNGYTMMDFRDFLRSAYSLKHSWATPVSPRSGRRPRLVMLLRRHSRSITNEAEAVSAASEAGFEVVAAGPEDVRDMARFAGVVNSCDVMVGVHGAGLTNMVFLPAGAVLIQVVPFGDLEWLTRVTFKEPAKDMEVSYMDYNVQLEESSLLDQYPRSHQVLADPAAVHAQGWDALKAAYLDKQNVRLNLDKFRATLREALSRLPPPAPAS